MNFDLCVWIVLYNYQSVGVDCAPRRRSRVLQERLMLLRSRVPGPSFLEDEARFEDLGSCEACGAEFIGVVIGALERVSTEARVGVQTAEPA